LELLTRIPLQPGEFKIGYDSRIVSIGSCFAVNIAEKFDYFQFRNTVNPLGILFHPLAIEKFFGFVTGGKVFTGQDVFFHNERWHCFDAHSDLSAVNKEHTLLALTGAIESTKQSLSQASHVIITLGTAWVYRNVKSQNLVANCHKVPQREFSKELLSVSTIAESLNNTVNLIEKSDPAISVLLTVSPVRHIKDGFVQNQRSKAHLIAAVHEVTGGRVSYFPSYEIMMDELRDYRFYASDLLHPNQLAIDYIWEKFAAAWISPEAVPVMAEVESIRKVLAHRPFNPDSDSHRNLLKSTLEKAEALQRRYPHITFTQNT